MNVVRIQIDERKKGQHIFVPFFTLYINGIIYRKSRQIILGFSHWIEPVKSF